VADRDPWFPFYPAHWLNDLEVITLPMDTQGIYINLLCYLYQANPPGFLLVSGSNPTDKCMGKCLRTHPTKYRRCLQELIDAKVLKVGDDGVVYSERILSDCAKRKKAIADGKKGGNPKLKQGEVKGGVNPPVKPENKESIETKREEEEGYHGTGRISGLYQKWEKFISIVPTPDVLPGLRLTLDWLDNQIALKGFVVGKDVAPAESIIAGEIESLSRKRPDKQTPEYLWGMVRGKWEENFGS
jgi:hypothetical protein